MMRARLLQHNLTAELPETLIRRLRTAMSSAAMLEILRRDWQGLGQPGEELIECQLVRVSARLPHGFVLSYEATLRKAESQRSQSFFGELIQSEPMPHCQRALGKLRKGGRRQLRQTGAPDPLAVLPGLGMVLRLTGYDERLHGLKFVHRPRLLGPPIREHVTGAHGTIRAIKPEVLGHRLGKRCIVRFRFDACDGDGGTVTRGSVIAKLYKSRTTKGQQVFADLRRLYADGFGDRSDLRVPRPFAFLTEENVLLMEDVPGKSLADLPAGELRAGLATAGRLLAKLHTDTVHPQHHHGADDEIALLGPWVALVSRVHPDLAGPAAEALAAVRLAFGACADARRVPSHRDFYDKQVLFTGRRATVIDFDTFCMADPALDLGNFLAHLELRRLQRTIPANGLADGFLDGYRRTSGWLPSGPRLAAYEAASLLRLGCLYALSTRWQTLARPLIEGSRAALRGRS